MKRAFLLVAAILCSLVGYAQDLNPGYDQALADSLGGDEYGMKAYVLVILKSGANKATGAPLNEAFKGHMANIGRLVDAGKLVVAGPLKKNQQSYRGIFILNVKTIEEATALIATDPAIKAHFLEAELYEWYGSAALPMYLSSHPKIERKKH